MITLKEIHSFWGALKNWLGLNNDFIDDLLNK